MKLLLDENLSPRLVVSLEPAFPGSCHVRSLGLESSPDSKVWEFAKEHGFAILSKDADFRQRSVLYGHPPKVIWLVIGNCSTSQIELLIRANLDSISEFGADAQAAILELP